MNVAAPLALVLLVVLYIIAKNSEKPDDGTP